MRFCPLPTFFFFLSFTLNVALLRCLQATKVFLVWSNIHANAIRKKIQLDSSPSIDRWNSGRRTKASFQSTSSRNRSLNLFTVPRYATLTKVTDCLTRLNLLAKEYRITVGRIVKFSKT